MNEPSLPLLPLEAIQAYRAHTFRLTAPVKHLDQAVDFVNERGFIFFWPIREAPFPNLWAAAAGDRPVADEHDDPGHVTWGWKDTMLGQRRWYYAKVLRKKAVMISLEAAPYFYALSENYGAPEEDYLTQYEQGRLTQEAKIIYEALLREGPLDTVALRKATHLSSRASDSRFNRAMTDLQTDFKILPVGVTNAGAWHYAFAYDLVARHFPQLPDQAQAISDSQARQTLVELSFRSMGWATLREVQRLFQWTPERTERVLAACQRSGLLTACTLENMPQPGFVLTELLNGK